MTHSRLIFSILVFLFGFSLVLFSALKLPRTSLVRAQAPDVEEKTVGEMDEVKTEEKKIERVDYYLPYPGILPDHPLYWLKMLRDRIRLLITKDVEGRFDRLLLYADKRIGAAKALIDGGQVDLGVTTATKAEKYLEEAVFQFDKVKEAGKAYPERVDTIEKAVGKHIEVLRAIKERVSDQAKPAVDQAIDRALTIQERIREKFKKREEEGKGEQIENETQTQERGEIQQENQEGNRDNIDKNIGNQQKGGV